MRLALLTALTALCLLRSQQARHANTRARTHARRYLVVTCNYPARQAGVTKLMGTADALRACPGLALVRLGAACMSSWRAAGLSVAAVMHVPNQPCSPACMTRMMVCHADSWRGSQSLPRCQQGDSRGAQQVRRSTRKRRAPPRCLQVHAMLPPAVPHADAAACWRLLCRWGPVEKLGLDESSVDISQASVM